jgi:hypothetical protein
VFHLEDELLLHIMSRAKVRLGRERSSGNDGGGRVWPIGGHNESA